MGRTTTVDLRLVFTNDPEAPDAEEILKYIKEWVNDNVRGWFGGNIGVKLSGQDELENGARITWQITHNDMNWNDWFQQIGEKDEN